MLEKLIIKNVALIDSVEINFIKGLNVLSGETGAGKSVIIESLNFVLGAKADKSLIRNGANECLVRAEFNVSDNTILKTVFDDLELEYDDTLIILRKFSVDGKSTIKVNGETVTASMLKRITVNLVDVHGQSEHFYLLKSSNQLKLLDKICGEEINVVKAELLNEYSQYKKIKTELEELGGDDSARLTRLDILDYQINEIENADLKSGEEEQLLEIRNQLNNQEKIIYALKTVKCAIDDEGGVVDILSNAIRSISSISDLSVEYSNLYDKLSSIYSEINDSSEITASLLDSFEYPEYNLDEIENRLDQIKLLKKKYGNDIEDIFAFLNKAKEEKDKLENFNFIAENLLKQKESCEKKLYNQYNVLSELRRKSARDFSINILNELSELGMKKASFAVTFNDFPSIEDCKFNSANGMDEIEFSFSANLGEPLKPLSAVISGGEMSRFMLAVKAQTAKYSDVSTFIFDEIDAGISGVVAKVVAEKFARIAKDVQIIAITHLPQISSMADNNLLIEKRDDGEKTLTYVNKLDNQQKINEIIRLTGGNVSSDAAKINAKELIEQAEKFKNNL